MDMTRSEPGGEWCAEDMLVWIRKMSLQVHVEGRVWCRERR